MSSAAQAQQFALPEGCEAFVTVQKNACVVTHNFTCAADPDGYTRRVDLNDAGVTFMSVVDSETQWIESTNMGSGITDRLGPVVEDPASFSNLLETGRDDWYFSQTASDGTVMVFRGYDELTGVDVVIDGVTLPQTYFEMTAQTVTGEELYRAKGFEHINPKWRIFLSGVREVATPDDSYSYDTTPRQFIFPGEAGFLTSDPIYDCDVMMSSFAN